MAITASVDITKNPIELTVTSDKRVVSVSVSAAGETATGSATFPVTVTDASRTWTKVSDTGLVAKYTS
jgi:hypothetical protein